MTPPSPESARALRDALRRLIVAHGTLEDSRRPCGTPLPTPHAWALMELRARGPMTITALARCLNIDRTNVSRLAARMESLGEVVRVRDPRDGRACLVTLTPGGQALGERVDQSSAHHFASVLEHLGGEGENTLKALQALTEALGCTIDQETL